ncbi:hypothetical protein JOD57_002813 [Geodermatophilus bullaregiensis]|nr:hypothetical protein [Geodermatophilus bullaregiensis]
MVLDYALIGLSKSGPQLTRNIIFSVAKLLLLPVIAMTAGLGATGIYGAWFLGHLISLIPLAARANHSIWPELVRPGMVLKGLGRSALAHHVTNTSSYAPVLVLPVVVAARLGTEANAAFYAATLLISSAWVITTHLATALFASAGAAPKDFARDLRFSLRISGTVAALTVLTAAPLAGPLLALFGAEYTRAQAGLVSLALATPFVSVKPLYIAVCRAEGQLRLGARVALIASFVEITAGAVGTLFGLTGTCAFFAVANFLEALVLWPRVARYAGLTIRSSRRPASWTPPEPPTAQD